MKARTSIAYQLTAPLISRIAQERPRIPLRLRTLRLTKAKARNEPTNKPISKPRMAPWYQSISMGSAVEAAPKAAATTGASVMVIRLGSRVTATAPAPSRAMTLLTVIPKPYGTSALAAQAEPSTPSTTPLTPETTPANRPSASAPRSTWLINTRSTPTAIASTLCDITDPPGMNIVAAVAAKEHNAMMMLIGHGASERTMRGQV